MTQFYTKDQIDFLGSTIGTRIKDSVNVNSVTQAILSSTEYHLLSLEEKASLESLLAQEPGTNTPCDPPASNINDYLSALDAAIEGTDVEDNTLWTASALSEIYNFYGGSGSSSSFYAKYRINNGPWITYKVDEEYDAVNSFFNSIKDKNNKFLIKNFGDSTTSFEYNESESTLTGFERSGLDIIEEYPVKIEFVTSEGNGNDLVQHLFSGSTTIYSLGRKNAEVIPKGSFLILKPSVQSELKTLNYSKSHDNTIRYFTDKKGLGFTQSDIDYIEANVSGINPLDGSTESEKVTERLLLELSVGSSYVSMDEGLGTIYPDFEFDYSSGTSIKGGFLAEGDSNIKSRTFIMYSDTVSANEVISSGTRRVSYPEDYGLVSASITTEGSFSKTEGKYLPETVTAQNYLKLFVDPEDSSYLNHPLYAEGYRPPEKVEGGYEFRVTKG